MNIIYLEARLARDDLSCLAKTPEAPGRRHLRAGNWPWIGPVVLLPLSALSAVLGGCQPRTAELTDAQLVAIVRQYGANLPHPVDSITGRAVRVERTPREWVVTVIDPRRLDTLPRHYVGGARSAYHIDRATLRVVSVVVTE